MSNRFCLAVGLAGLCMLVLPDIAGAQTFLRSRPTAYETEIATATSGMRMEVSATVLPDMKYVHLNMQPRQQAVLSMTNFTFTGGPGGQDAPGIPAPTDPNTVPRSQQTPRVGQSSPTDVLARADNPLLREGTHRLSFAN